MHLINLIESHDNWFAWGDIKHLIVWPDKALCEICNGSGKATTNKCPECDGDGAVDAETEYNTYHDLKCKTCDGKGLEVNLRTDQDCPRCDGNSVAYVPYDSVDVLGITVQAQYLNLIIDETGLELGANHDRNMLIFRAGPDVHGAIMALRK